MSHSITSAASSSKPSCARPFTSTVYVTSFGVAASSFFMRSKRSRARWSSPTRTHAFRRFVYEYTFGLNFRGPSAMRRNASSANPSCLSFPKSFTRRLKNFNRSSSLCLRLTARFNSVCASLARFRFALTFLAMPSSNAASAPYDTGSMRVVPRPDVESGGVERGGFEGGADVRARFSAAVVVSSPSPSPSRCPSSPPRYFSRRRYFFDGGDRAASASTRSSRRFRRRIWK
eukprot:31033-Pelagococcus_subviridis.AAC.12